MAKKAKAAEKKTGDADLNSGAFQAEAKPILGVDLKGELKDIPLHQVVDPDGTPDRMQRPGDEAAIAQLARSMRECGQLQPVMVEVLNQGKAEAYRRVFGRRRIAAARSLGWTTIRASVVGELPADVRRTVVAIENVQRQDLTPAEETLAVDELMRLQAFAATRQFNSRLGPECGAHAGKLVTDGLLADITGASDQVQRAAQHDLLLDHRVRGIAAELVAAMLGKPASWVRDRLYIGRLGEAAKKLVLDGKLPLAAPAAIAKRQALRGAALRGLKPGFRSCELLVELLRKSTGEWHSLPVQIHRYTPQNRGWIELMRTGPSELGILFLERWKKVYGLGDSEASRSGHLRNSYGDIVPVRTEEEAFEKCGIPYVPPDRRGVWAESILQARRLKGESIGRSA
jgi:ParB/RepB/Spo0J family partition protein